MNKPMSIVDKVDLLRSLESKVDLWERFLSVNERKIYIGHKNHHYHGHNSDYTIHLPGDLANNLFPIIESYVAKEREKLEAFRNEIEGKEDKDKCTYDNHPCRWHTRKVNDSFCPKHRKMMENHKTSKENE